MTSLTKEEFKTKVFDYTGNDFKSLGTKPIVVSFYAEWCEPCKMMLPILENVVSGNTGVDFYQIDILKETEICTYLHINNVPALLFIPVGNVPNARLNGFSNESRIQEKIDTLFK